MTVFAAPLAADKVGAWEAWVGELVGPRRDDLDDMNERHGLTTHAAYLQPTPDGDYLVLVVHEGPGGETFLENVVASDHEFDRWFATNVAELHDMDLSGPLPPPPVRKL